MKNKKLLKTISIILTMGIILVDIWLFIKTRNNWGKIGTDYDQYENLGIILGSLFEFGILIWGILLIPIIWLQYFLINLLINIYNKSNNTLKYLLCLIILIAIITILIFFIKILFIIIKILI